MTESDKSQLRIVIALSNKLDCLGLRALAEKSTEISVIATTTYLEPLDEICSELRPEILVLDANFPEESAIRAAEQLQKKYDFLSFLFLDDKRYYARAIRMKEIIKIRYMTRESDFETVLAAMKQLVSEESTSTGGTLESRKLWIDKNTPGVHIHRKGIIALTDRELEVIRMVAEGNKTNEIASMLGLSQSTIDNHKARAYRKLGLNKVSSLTRLAMREKLIE